MKPDLEELRISERELENLSGFDVNELFIGGVFGGVYRPSALKNTQKLAFLCLTEIFVSVLMFIFTLPIGLLVIRNSTNTINSYPMISQFLQITLGITLTVVISWNVYMWFRVKHIKTLARLLDEVDKYNEIIKAIALFDKLKETGSIEIGLTNRSKVLEVLSITRDTLVNGLMTEKILRENRSLIARSYDLFTNIENNLLTLRTLEVENQASDYGKILNNTLQIGISVHKEMQKLSHSYRAE